MVSNRIKSNIHAALCLIGIACVIARGWDVALDPSSGKAWFKLCGIILLTGLCLSNYRDYRRRAKADTAPADN
ncbi:MAG: hypothetical protein NC210_05820 [[Clostridium] fimetarium]|nr:hypothetical protein [Alistipes timonensis]MCM1405922.1 hypothetical protein [[Clostridium] fimetarium]